MWLPSNDWNEWIEIGDVDGSMNGTYWKGHFTAFQKYNSSTQQYDYYEYTIGSSSPTGTHNFEIQYTGNLSPWSSYVDYNKVMDYNFSYTSGYPLMVGIETDEDTATFTNGLYNNSLQWKNSANVWSNWTAPYVVNFDDNNLGWTSSYTSNRVTLNH